jgi:AraC-like DNA-binding protein
MVKVIFQTGAMYRLLGIPSFEFQSLDIDSDCILPAHEIKSVNEQLLNTQNYAEMINIVERYMTSKIKKVKTEIHPIDRVAEMITLYPTTFSLDDYARKAFLSTRQFDRKFVERIGITPRLFQRIARFHHAFDMKDKNPRLDWLSVAYDSGYTDYQHLVKDFKAFSTLTPNLLLDRNTERHDPAKVLKLL